METATPPPPTSPSDLNFADNFDAPIVEPVRLKGPDGKVEPFDALFARVDMDYLETWANNLRQKRRLENMAELNKKLGLNPLAYAQAQAKIYAIDVQIFEVMDMQFFPAGIKKILDDALMRGGMTDANQRRRVIKAIWPQRQQQLASEIMSEPKATVEQLRDSVKRLAGSLGRPAAEVANWTDAQLIEFASTYTPPQAAQGEDKKPGASDDEAADGGENVFANPTVPGVAEPGTASIGELATH